MEWAQQIPLLYRGNGYVIIDKPAGVLSHPHPRDRESPILLDLLTEQLGIPVFTVHRLDRMTTGVMVLATDKRSAAHLCDQFADHRVEKHYLALVRGHTEEHGEIDAPLPHRTRDTESPALTRFRTVAQASLPVAVGRYEQAWFSLVDAELLTGRTHQARRHLHRINHPVLGDLRHGDNDYNRWAIPKYGRYLFLRARSLSFAAPEDGRQIVARAGLSEVWERAVAEIFGSIPDELQGQSEATLSR